jgi:hypothetical protein
MTDVVSELQGALYDRLRATGGVTALVGTRIYDRVPPSPTFPYVSFGPSQAVSDDADCITAYEVSVQIDVWSRTVGRVEASQIADAVRRAILGADMTLTTNALVMIEHRDTRIFRDPDGQTNHAVLIFSASVEEA